jgi:hypothetical protein
MIVKDYSAFVDEKGEIPLVERIRGTLKYGSSWHADIQAQEMIIERMQTALSDEYIALRNLVLPGLDVPIPLVLIGPAGVKIIYVSAVKGIYQAKGEQWSVMNTNSRRFRPSRPNLITRALLLSQAALRHLERQELANIPLDSINFFADPGIHVDTKSPATRIVMIDALDRYIASIIQSPAVITAERVQKVVDVLTRPPSSLAGGELSPEEDLRIQEAFSIPRVGPINSNRTELRVPILGSLRFTSGQWYLLGTMVLVNIILIAAFIVLVLFYQ